MKSSIILTQETSGYSKRYKLNTYMGIRDRINGVDVKLDGRDLISASSPRPRVDIDILDADKTVQGLTTYDASVSLKGDVGFTPFDSDGEISVDAYSASTNMMGEDKLHMYHLEVPEGLRGKGLGSTLFNIYKEFAIQANFNRVSLRVGGGEKTKKFLVKNGVNPEYLHVHTFPGARVTSVVLTTESNFRQIKGIRSIKETSDQIQGVFPEAAFTDYP